MHPSLKHSARRLWRRTLLRRVPLLLLILAGVSLTSTGCATVIMPVIKFDKVDHPKLPDPIFSGPGGVGPIFNEPTIMTGPACCKSSCNGCPPSRPLQPIDPFGWLRTGSQGTHIVDPIGWVIGL